MPNLILPSVYSRQAQLELITHWSYRIASKRHTLGTVTDLSMGPYDKTTTSNQNVFFLLMTGWNKDRGVYNAEFIMLFFFFTTIPSNTKKLFKLTYMYLNVKGDPKVSSDARFLGTCKILQFDGTEQPLLYGPHEDLEQASKKYIRLTHRSAWSRCVWCVILSDRVE